MAGLGGDGRPWYGLRARPRRRRVAAGRSRRPRDVTGDVRPRLQQSADRFVQLRQATAGHSMVCARVRSQPATAGHSRPLQSHRALTLESNTGAAWAGCRRGDVRPHSPTKIIVDRVVGPRPASGARAPWRRATAGHGRAGRLQEPPQSAKIVDRPRPVTAGHGPSQQATAPKKGVDRWGPASSRHVRSRPRGPASTSSGSEPHSKNSFRIVLGSFREF